MRGRNLLLVKLSSISSLRIRVRDDKGQPSKNIMSVVPKAGDKKVVMRGVDPASLQAGMPKELLKYQALGDIMEKAGDKKWLAYHRLSYAAEAEARGLSDLANWSAGTAGLRESDK